MHPKKLTTDEAGILILFASIIFGAVFRFLPTWMAGFPINDGGMFASMINDLYANRFIPPLYTSYNNLNIPFAYPPLGFYIGAILKSIFNISEIEILRWLPALLNTFCIPAFYFFAKEIFNNKSTASIATIAFAFTPHLNTWLSAGGGLTRSLGTLFLIFTLIFSWKLFAKNESKAIWGVILFGSLVILSHTESTIFAIALPVFIWLMKSRSLKSAIQAGWIALGVILIAGPWYGFVISRHGYEPLLSALQTGSQSLWGFLRLINIDIVTEEPYLDILGVTGVLGMIFLLIRKDTFIPLMLLVMQFAQPRSAHTIGNIPLAMASAFFFTEVLLPAFSSSSTSNRNIKIFLIVLTPYLFINSIYHGFMLSEHHVTDEAQSTMQWVRENTPVDATFMIITTESDPMCDSTSEWFPALTKRTSLTTLQGREWLSDKNFNEFIGQRATLQACNDIQCLNNSIHYFGEADYIYISLNTPTNSCKLSTALNKTPKNLPALRNSNLYNLIYESDDVVIFEKIK